MNAPLRFALALSALVHALFCVWVEVRGKKSETVAALTPDRFSGSGIEVEAIPLDHAGASDAAEVAAREAAAREEAARAEAAATERETTTPPPDSAPEPAKPSTENATEPGAVVERPRKPRLITPKPAPTPPAVSNTEKLASIPAPLPSASATGGGDTGTSADAAAGEASGSASAGSVAGASAPYGTAGLPPGVRHLPRAFTRALALANRGDTRWREVSAGRVGEAHLRLAVDAEGQLGPLEYESDQERDQLAPVVKKLFDNTLLLLKNGRFSVDPRTLSAGVTRLRVMVEVTDGGAPRAEGDPVELFGLASAAPEPGKPGKSGFVLNSGRQVTAWVWLE